MGLIAVRLLPCIAVQVKQLTAIGQLQYIVHPFVGNRSKLDLILFQSTQFPQIGKYVALIRGVILFLDQRNQTGPGIIFISWKSGQFPNRSPTVAPTIGETPGRSPRNPRAATEPLPRTGLPVGPGAAVC